MNVGKQILKKFVGLRAKTYSYLKENSGKDKKLKRTKSCAKKIKIKFENCFNFNPNQDDNWREGQKDLPSPSLYQFFPCIFCKRRNYPPRLSHF